MDQLSMDILEVLLEKGELNNHEIVSVIERKLSRRLLEKGSAKKLNHASIKVMVTNKLRGTKKVKGLTAEFLQRNDVGHKNVQYAFKNEKAREKAKQVVYLTAAEWERVMSEFLESKKKGKIGSEATLEAWHEFVALVPGGLLLLGYFYNLADAVVRNDLRELDFYREQAKKTLTLFLESLIKLLQKEPPDHLRDWVSAERRDGDMDLLPTDPSKLLEFLEKGVNVCERK
jgi:hypothetical protein